MLYARPSTNTSELRRLAVEYEQRYHEQRGPAFDTYVRKHNLQRYLKPYQGATLMGLSPDGRPIIYAIENLDAARSVRTNMLWPGGASGYDLSGFGTDDLAMWDAGSVRATHREFNNLGFPRLVNIDHTATHYHATHIAGTLVAGGLDTDARGMSYEARIDAYDWYNDLSEIAAAAADGIRVSNHSYGIYAGWEFQDDGWHWYGNPAIDSREDWKFGFYDVEAHDFDELAHNAPYLTIVTAAGNDRSDQGPPPGTGHWVGLGNDVWSTDERDPDGGDDGYDCLNDKSLAKNVISVGAVNDVVHYQGPDDVVMSAFSAWGPTDDGRIKPDIVANGIGLYSTGNDNDDDYHITSGTSCSSPNVAGTVNLLHQLYVDQFHADPLSSTMRGVVIHTADECGPWDGPDYMFGWGLVNARAAADVIAGSVDNPETLQEVELNDGELFTEQIDVPGDQPLRITICWNDPPATVLPDQINNPTPRLINDLDLRLRRLGDNEVFEPWVLGGFDNPDQPAGTGDNSADNVEQVYMTDPVAGEYQVEVSHEGTLDGPQFFSLIITGIGGDPNENYLALSPQNDTVPAGGGVIVYDAELNNATGQTHNVDAWTMVTLPNGNDFGPVMQMSFSLALGMHSFDGLQLAVPAYAPGGDYLFTANVGFYPNFVGLTDSFSFTKTATGLNINDSTQFDDWYAAPWQEPATVGDSAELPGKFTLSAAWPNPFNDATVVQLRLPETRQVDVAVYDVQGRLVAILANGAMSGGVHSLSWSAAEQASGMYFIQAMSGELNAVQKVALVR